MFRLFGAERKRVLAICPSLPEKALGDMGAIVTNFKEVMPNLNKINGTSTELLHSFHLTVAGATKKIKLICLVSTQLVNQIIGRILKG